MSFTKENKISFISENCYTILGLISQEIKARHFSWNKIIDAEEEKKLTEIWQNVLQTNTPQSSEIKIWQNVTCEKRWFDIRIIPYESRVSDEVMIVVLVDITERKKVEEDRKRLEKQLRHTEKIETIGKLAGGIAHDFNNLLGAISSMIEIIEEEVPLSPLYEKRLEMVLKAIESGAEMNQQLLSFSRMDDLTIEPVANQETGGAKFLLFLPVTDQKSSEDVVATKEIRHSPNGETILLVDDEELIRESTADTLRKYGYIVHEKANGKEAVEYFQEHANDIDLVILDMLMPIMSGKEAFMEIKKINPEVKVVLATGYSQQNDLDDIEDQKIDMIIEKPFRVKKLVSSINSLLSEKVIKDKTIL